MSKPYSSYDSASNLMVNYLPANMDESEFRALFEAIGSLRISNGYVITKFILNIISVRVIVYTWLFFFFNIGPIKSCRLIKDRSSGHNAGYGFVDFENQGEYN